MLVIIIDLPSLTTFTTGTSSFYNTTNLTIECIWILFIVIFSIDLPNLKTISIGDSSFRYTSSVSIMSILWYLFNLL